MAVKVIEYSRSKASVPIVLGAIVILMAIFLVVMEFSTPGWQNGICRFLLSESVSCKRLLEET